MFTYVYVGTNDLERATRFYDATMASLGLQRCVTNDPEWDRISAGWGTYEDGGVRELAFWVGKPFDQRPATTLQVSRTRTLHGHARHSPTMPRCQTISLDRHGAYDRRARIK